MENEKEEIMSGEQAADLAALRAKVNEEPGQLSDGKIELEQRVELAGELKMLILLAAGALAPAFPSLAEIYTEQTAGAAGHAIASVCNKHGWMQDGVGGKWGEEIAAAAIILPLAWATYQGVQTDIAKRVKTKPEAQQLQQASEEPVVFGSPVEPVMETVAA